MTLPQQVSSCTDLQDKVNADWTMWQAVLATTGQNICDSPQLKDYCKKHCNTCTSGGRRRLSKTEDNDLIWDTYGLLRPSRISPSNRGSYTLSSNGIVLNDTVTVVEATNLTVIGNRNSPTLPIIKPKYNTTGDYKNKFRLFLVRGELRLEYVRLQGGLVRWWSRRKCSELAFFFCGGNQIYLGDGAFSASNPRALLHIKDSVLDGSGDENFPIGERKEAMGGAITMFGLSEDDILNHVGSDIILRNIVKMLGVNAAEAHVTNTTVTNNTAGVGGGIEGKYPNKPGQVLCLPCVPGKYQDKPSSVECKNCSVGRYTDTTRALACKRCDPGSSNFEPGSTFCEKCLPGYYGEECTICPAGFVRDSESKNTSSCSKCGPGKYQNQKGKALCYECPPGKMQNSPGQKECDECPSGQYQPNPRQKSCNSSISGKEVTIQGVVKIKIPPGFVETVCVGLDPCPSERFVPCSPGKYQTIEGGKHKCMNCTAGYGSDQNGSTACSECSRGKYAESPGISCKECPKGYYQSDTRGLSCKECPVGWEGTSKGESGCQDQGVGLVYAESCTNEQYLNDAGDRTSWKCEACLEGASCLGPVKLSTLPNMFGWWRIPNTSVYAQCLYPPACPGGPNPVLAGKYFDVNGNDLSKKNGAGCAVNLGFKNSSRLCHACALDHRRKGSSECAKCPTSGQNWGLIMLGLLLIFLMLIYVVRSTLNQGETVGVSQSVKKIMLNYLQVIALARSFPLRWNGVFRTLFEVQGAISTLGDHIVNVDCVSTSETAAELFYGKQIMYMVLPVITGFLGFLFWVSYGLLQGVPFFAKRAGKQMRTPKDKFIVTVTAILFLMYPTMCEKAFAMFSCKTIGGIEYLQVDLEEPCYESRHLSMTLLLGLPQLFLYVLGLPLLILKFLKRNRAHLFKNPVALTRWGLFFKGYKEDRYYWELVITLRKVCVVALSVFGRELGVQRQSLVVILILLACIILEIVGQPFKEVTKSHRILKWLEITALLVEFGTLWCGLMIFQSGPKSEGMNVFMTICVVAANIGLTLWFSSILLRACTEQTKCLRIMQRIRKSLWGERDQMRIRERTFDAQDGRNIDNPFDGAIGTDVQGASPMVEMVDRLKVLKKVKAVKSRSFERYETDDGEEFFVEVGTGESVWDLPSDGKVVG
eukprot:g4566.t1